MKSMFKVSKSNVRNDAGEVQRSIQIYKNGESELFIGEDQFEVVDGKATKVLDRLWDMSEAKILETVIEEELIYA